MNVSILLTEEEPTVDTAARIVDLGRHHDGIFVVESYPTEISSGGVVEVRYENDETGVHEIAVVGIIAGEDQEHPIHREPFVHEIPEYADDFQASTTSLDVFPLKATVYGDLEIILRVDVDGEPCAYSQIAVRSSSLGGLPLTVGP
jgi:hypothetical protein